MILIEWFLDFVGYRTARLLVPLLSFGTVRVEHLSAAAPGFNWAGFKRDETGRLVMSFMMATLLGGLFWFLMLALAMSFIRAA